MTNYTGRSGVPIKSTMTSKHKSIKAYSVIFKDDNFINQDLMTWIFRTKGNAESFIGIQEAEIVEVLIKQINK